MLPLSFLRVCHQFPVATSVASRPPELALPVSRPPVSGGYIGGVPPVPIPNTEVKPSRADGTARFPCGRVGRCRNFLHDAPPLEQSRGASLFGKAWKRFTRSV